MEQIAELKIKLALQDQGGPPEIAAQLIAIAQAEMIGVRPLVEWIAYHKGEEWSASQFQQWCQKYNAVLRGLTQNENR